MSNVINLNEHQAPTWLSIYDIEGDYSSMQVHSNTKTNELEIVQMNNVDESIRTVLSKSDATELLRALAVSLGAKVELKVK